MRRARWRAVAAIGLVLAVAALGCGAPGESAPSERAPEGGVASDHDARGAGDAGPPSTNDAAAPALSMGCVGAPALDGVVDSRSELRGLEQLFETAGGYIAILRTELGVAAWRLDERLREVTPPRDVLAYDRATAASPIAHRVIRDEANGFVAAAVYRGHRGETLVVRDLDAEGAPSVEARAPISDSLDRYDDSIALAVAPSGERFVAVTDIPLVARFVRGAATIELSETAACPAAHALATGGAILDAAWSGSSFDALCGSSFARFRPGAADEAAPLEAASLPPTDCVASARVVWDGDGFARLAWTYEGKASAQGGVVCGDGFTVPAYSALAEGARVTLKVSRLEGRRFGAWKSIHSYARPRGASWRADAVRDGAGYLVVSERSDTEWEVRSVDHDGRDRAASLTFPVDARAFAPRLVPVRGGVLVRWALGDASAGGGGAQRIACR